MPRPETAPFALTATRRHALTLLHEAHQTAQEAGRPTWDYACQLPHLQHQGVSETCLRWLVDLGLAAHRLEITSTTSGQRAFRLASNLCLEPASCFTLSPAGLALLEGMIAGQSFAHDPYSPPPAAGSPTPHYDAHARTLSFAGQIIKQFRVPAENQELILQAFEEENWPTHIDDPLPRAPELCPKKRLNDAVYRLNCRQQTQRLRFSLNGMATGVKWREIDV